ncbi:hypothetical protein [Streptomyces sp. NBC_00154]|uniref:hypothetical protein n=1 Tax=Streptomyces sp. NBC_00154 TaxID=2975670 RepID=UPI002253EEE0|nr:hypothetical protein [Streptomyces sp. NBC_00154]MCX5317845.1 hypothetical protein [Streptomyces sp. NBC_00154]
MEQSQVEAMPPERIRYRYTRLQHVLPVLPLLFVIWGTKVWDWMTWKPAGAEIAESFGMWGAMLFVLLITGQYFGVTLTESTAIVHSLRRRTIQWSNVQAIRIERFQGAQIVVIYEAGGRRTRLRAPITGFLCWDRGFEEKFDTIGRWWLDHRGPDWAPVLLPGAQLSGPPVPDGNPFGSPT